MIRGSRPGPRRADVGPRDLLAVRVEEGDALDACVGGHGVDDRGALHLAVCIAAAVALGRALDGGLARTALGDRLTALLRPGQGDDDHDSREHPDRAGLPTDFVVRHHIAPCGECREAPEAPTAPRDVRLHRSPQGWSRADKAVKVRAPSGPSWVDVSARATGCADTSNGKSCRGGRLSLDVMVQAGTPPGRDRTDTRRRPCATC
ncbi:hypothetical protein N865_08490 [Intrasporangium oryzae NRRL B-24470]|uniref:Uncharacterized protein n=1 Tax=Intrasporangium oryzae NRRL B-24470 TaxID=1386089 RepID=W9G5A7_9MICO|nr:hypothetical protein N865_08490 [Intrasporangium oryzae NRRL B-24470]